MKSSVLLSVAISSAILLGCGGGSESNTNSPTTPIKDEPTAVLRGIAIDGYLTGARAFIDYNFNGQWDEPEPFAVTAENGQFQFMPNELAACWRFAPLIIDVPVGAHDSDHGVVTEAYQLIAPPQFVNAYPEQARVVSPFTSLVWQQVEFEWLTRYPQLTCTQLAEQPVKQRVLQGLIEEQEQHVMAFFQLTRDQLYGDFIASGDRQLHQTANLLVQGFAAAKQQTPEFAEQHHHARQARLAYYLRYPQWLENGSVSPRHLVANDSLSVHTNDLIEKSWYRSERVIGEQEASWRRYLMSDDRQQKLALEALNQHQQQLVGEVVRTIDSAWQQGQRCLVAVRYQTINTTWDNRHYELVARLVVPFSESQQQCDTDSILASDSLNQLDSLTVIISRYDTYDRMVSRSRHDFALGRHDVVDATWLAMTQNVYPLHYELENLSFIQSDIDQAQAYHAQQWVRESIVYRANQYTWLERLDSGLWFEWQQRNGQVTLRCGHELDKQLAQTRGECYQRFAQPVFSETFDGSLSSFGQTIVANQWVERQSGIGVDGSSAIKVTYQGYEHGSERVLASTTILPAERYELSFDVRFCPDFQFVRGGKLHGLGPRRGVSGGHPIFDEGWSARLIFGRNGTLGAYVYHQDMPGQYGTVQYISDFYFETNRYYHLRMVVQVNQPAAASNGYLEIWIDGKKRMVYDHLRFRASDSQDSQIQRILFHTFHGGNDIGSAPRDEFGNFTQECAYFDNFMVRR
ncbi:polysaccharide lyase [Vibrio metschnikovii]|uniref:polysaccharide lyase n=1 Tax=Vibrio metschnikovii TaxID=28172 RepID=UPI002FCA57C3